MSPAAASRRHAALPEGSGTGTALPPAVAPPAAALDRRAGAAQGDAGSGWRGALREDAPFLGVIAGHVLAGVAMGHPPRVDTMLRVWFLSAYPLAICAIWLLASYGLFQRRRLGAEPGMTPGQLWRAYRAEWLTDRRAAGFAVVFLAFPLVMSQYISLKSGMSSFAPFSWDARLAGWDRALHFGRDPWRILHPLLARPVVTNVLDVLYYVWFPMKAAVIVSLAWSGSRVLRLQGLVTYAAVLALLGNGLAALLSSAGPVYFARVTGLADPYEPLFRYLHSVVLYDNLLSLDSQAALWAAYTGVGDFAFSGISAAPSIHVALSVLFALVGWRAGRWIGGALTLYAFCIFLGSIHLGWHYALDGYVSAVLVLGTWKVAGWWAERHFRRTGLSRRLEGGAEAGVVD